MSMLAALNEHAAALVGLPCIGVAAGRGTGSVISANFGAIPLDQPSRNPHLSERLRTHRGKYILYVECAWRLEAADRVICGSLDDNSPGGPMLNGLAELEDAVVVGVEGPEPPGLDLTVRFEKGLSLRIFCDQVDLRDPIDNYTIIGPDYSVTVGARGALQQEPRS